MAEHESKEYLRKNMSTDLSLDLLQEYAEEKGKDISSMYFRCKADAALHLIAVDRGTTDVTGYTPEELVATGMVTLMDLVAPKARDDLRYNIQQGVGEGKAFASWFVLRRKDKSTAQAFIQGRANVSQQLQLIDIEGYIATSTIIDQQFAVQDAEIPHDTMVPRSVPAAADPGYVHLLNYSAEVLGLINKLDEIEYITPALQRVSQVIPGDHQLFASIFSLDSASHIEKAIQEVRQTGKRIDKLQVHLENREGIPTIVDLSLSPAGSHSSATLFRIEMPQPSHSFEAKEEKHSDTQSQETELTELYQQAFLSNAMGMAITEHDTNTVIEVNNQFLSLFEYEDRNEVLNNSIEHLKVISETDIKRIHDATDVNGLARQHQIEIITHHGNRRHFLVSAQALHLSDGAYIVYFFEAGSPVQEAQSDKSTGDQTSGDQIVSEELTTLLSLLKMVTKKGEKNNITKCGGFLTSVLYLHDPTCQDIDGKRIAMDVYLGKITKSYIENYERSETEYEFICDHGLVFDRTLAQGCGMVAVELISNSLRHAFGPGEMGKVTISMIRDQTEGNYLLSVTDTGSGMAEFDETEESGIAMVRDIAKSLRGSVEVTSTANGARVTMVFPIPVVF